MLALIENLGNVYLYNEKEGLYKVPISKPIKTVKFINLSFYAMTINRDLIYEFSNNDTGLSFKFSNYYLSNVFYINSEIASKLFMYNLPYFSELLLFYIGKITLNKHYYIY